MKALKEAGPRRHVSLQTIAKDLGIEVIKEKISFESLEKFSEIGACGTAAIITPVYSIDRKGMTYTFGEPERAGEITTKLYERLEAIRLGEVDDKFGWLVEV